MKIVIAFALLLLSGCASVDRLGPYELAPARNPPSMTVKPVNLDAVNHAPSCAGSVVSGVCYESTSADGKIAANSSSAAGN